MYEKLYHELLIKYNDLEQENKQLRKQLGLMDKSNKPLDVLDCEVKIDKYSSPTLKVKLFRSLFQGRDDVFAKRWNNKTSGKSGYQPVCKNEWIDGVCDKKKNKCSTCPNRALKALTDSDIYKHLEGKDALARDVIGIYPMLQDETCLFLCADFDEESFEKDVSAYKEVCIENDVPVYIERSRSGNGAHAWIFFESPVSAVLARKLGSGILTKAMEKRGDLSFKSYDRFFPNQDTMPEGGFGNLVALPLQGIARKNGNSVFVDEFFHPYEDQWAYLSAVKKMNAESVEQLVASFGKEGELGQLANSSEGKPWETQKKISISNKDFPTLLTIVRANMLYVPSLELTENAKNRIKRLAAFKNPEFYRAQAMRLPIYDKPRIICTADITEEYIAIPRGCEEALCDLLDKSNILYIFEDKTNLGKSIPVAFNGELRGEQAEAANALLEHNNGVLSATTAFGKTVIASFIIGEKKQGVLVLVPTQALMEQWKKSLESFLHFDVVPPEEKKGRDRKTAWSPVGVLGAGKNTLHGMVDVAIMQSLIVGDEVKELVRDYGMIIVDECHHVSAVYFEMILKYANAKYVYGLTATPTRQDGHHPIIFMQCGPIRYRVDAKEQAEKRDFEHYLVPRFTNIRYSFNEETNISDVYKKLSENEARNNMIISDIVEAVNNGRHPIVLTERREHVALLYSKLLQFCKNVIQLVGSASQKERKDAMQKLNSIPAEESCIIVATGKYIGEGFDCPRLDTLFLALPISWKGKVAQYAGRLHRNYDGKTEVQVYDYADIQTPMLEKMYQKRVKSYSSMGYKTKLLSNDDNSYDLIYNGESYYKHYCNDLRKAHAEIFIVSPHMEENYVFDFLEQISDAIKNDIHITIITKPIEDVGENDRENINSCVQYLQKHGILIKYMSDFYQRFTVIDRSIVWYGSVDALTRGKSEDSIMRFENSDIAEQLMNTIL